MELSYDDRLKFYKYIASGGKSRKYSSVVNQMTNSYGPLVNKYPLNKRDRYAAIEKFINIAIKNKDVIIVDDVLTFK